MIILNCWRDLKANWVGGSSHLFDGAGLNFARAGEEKNEHDMCWFWLFAQTEETIGEIYNRAPQRMDIQSGCWILSATCTCVVAAARSEKPFV